MNKNLYICGCSHLNGWYLKKQKPRTPSRTIPFASLLAEKLSLNPVMVAHQGSSNYFIIKQIEFAIENNADYIIFDITTPLRFDWVMDGSNLISNPKFEDFLCDYNLAHNSPNNKPKIRSTAYQAIFNYVPDKDLSRFLAMYTDEHILVDQATLMFLGIISKLEKANIKYIAIDCSSEMFSNVPTTSIGDNISWKDILTKFPNAEDPLHLSQEGHQVVADLLLDKAKAIFN